MSQPTDSSSRYACHNFRCFFFFGLGNLRLIAFFFLNLCLFVCLFLEAGTVVFEETKVK